MRTTIRLLSFFTAITASALASMKPALGHCPLCAAATAGGVAATRLMGVDDTVTGTFVGGFVASTGLWFNNWFKKRNGGRELLQFQWLIVVLLSLAFTAATFYFAKLVGSSEPGFLMFGVDKLLIGTSAGTMVTLSAFALHQRLKLMNKGSSIMPFQGIVLTLLSLSAAGALFFFVT